MKAKIFAKLKQEYSSLGLGDEALMSRAEALAASGFVTDDNIDAVVFAQRSDLQNIQKLADSRVTGAVEKQRKGHEEVLKKLEAEKTEALNRIAEMEKAQRSAEGNSEGAANSANITDDHRFADLEARINKLVEEGKAANARYEESLKTSSEKRSELEKRISELTEENNRAKAEAARAARQTMILDKAKTLGVPQWRIDEGFTIADDATEESITETLTKVANNINANLLPGNRGFAPLGGSEPTKEEIDGLAATLVK